MNFRRFLKWYFIVPAGLAGFAAFIALGGFVVMLLWNWLVPPLIGLATITFWQGLGLLALARILVGGWNFGQGGHSGHMSREERERFREHMRRHDRDTPGEGQET